MAKDYTTTDVSLVLGLSVRTVVKLIDSGKLPAHKLLNGTHRRVTISDLVKFIQVNNIPTNDPHILGLLGQIPASRAEEDVPRSIEDIVRNVELFAANKDCCLETIRRDVSSVLAGYKALSMGAPTQ